MNNKNTITLWRPVGPNELKLIEESGWKRFPKRLAQQPIFYPVLNEEYAVQIARDWNVNASGSGYVTRFEVLEDYVSKFKVENVGGPIHNELWVPAEDLETFNDHIVGDIIVTHGYYAENFQGERKYKS
ncbi:MAG TPA: ADP-ribosylation/crystallin J1 [Flavobacteriales bacterium]|nr:ADP-ribosylation/crystallin J1 [Flavobacteriales bacterium]